MSDWYIALPGPSLSADDFPDDGSPLICVNSALKVAPRCDYWGAFDAPNEVHEVAWPTFLQLRPSVVTDKARVKMWTTYFQKRKLDRTTWPNLLTPDYGPLWFKLAAKSPFYTSFAVMSFAIQAGATRVNLIGCDLDGEGYYDQETNDCPRVARRPKRVWTSRWQREREMLGRVVASAREHGIEFTGTPRDLA